MYGGDGDEHEQHEQPLQEPVPNDPLVDDTLDQDPPMDPAPMHLGSQNPEAVGEDLPVQETSSPGQKTSTSPESESEKTMDSERAEPMQQEGEVEEKDEEMEEDDEDEEEEEDDEAPLEPTILGNAIDSLMMHWCQLLTNVSVKAPVPPPSTLDHVKEVAEVCSKHFRDSSVDVTNEFMRLGIQWEMEQAAEQFVTEDANLDEAIERQEMFLEQIREMLDRRVRIFNHENPNAGKHFTT